MHLLAPDDDARLVRIMALAPGALRDANAWWDVARVLPLAAARFATRGVPRESREAIRVVCRAGRQRIDVRAGALHLEALVSAP
jgi:hypothetical protein